VLAVFVTFAACSHADEQPAWQPMLGGMVKAEKAGFGGLCGIAVDRATGAVWINISDRGFYRSDDQAKTFKRASDKQPKGRTESPGSFMLDPSGISKRMVSALVYGSPVSVSADGGQTWKFLDGNSAHVDWCAVDWTDPDMKFVLALKHESGGLLIASHDGGATFTELGKGYGPGWVFDARTAVVAQARSKERPKPSLLRTTDGGKTWRPCGELSPVGANSAQALPKWFGDSLYWLVEGALIRSDDKAETWKKVSDLKDGRYGPVFGKDNKHIFVLTGTGVIETTDGGATWSKSLAPPEDLKGVGGLTWLAYDSKNDVLYLMKMGSDLFKLTRN
jgi:photosystem II stability/assembly factor-like uncharacterized protein